MCIPLEVSVKILLYNLSNPLSFTYITVPTTWQPGGYISILKWKFIFVSAWKVCEQARKAGCHVSSVQEMSVGLPSAQIMLSHDSHHLIVISDHGDSEQVERCYRKGYKFIVSLAPLLLGISQDCKLFSSVSQPISPVSKFRSKMK